MYVLATVFVQADLAIHRPYWVNSFQQMYQRRSFSSWSRVSPIPPRITPPKPETRIWSVHRRIRRWILDRHSRYVTLSVDTSYSLTTRSLKLFSHSIRDLPALGELVVDNSFYPLLIYPKATVAEKHGQRTVLLISLIGSAITCFLFGTSTSMNEALVIRLLQGTFAGAMGVARGTVAVITDQTNEGRAWAVLG